MRQEVKKFLAEFTGTFVLVFIGTGAIILDQEYPNSLGEIGVSIAFGFSVFSMILAFGKISGAHINPAVTWVVLLQRAIPLKTAGGYLVFQFLGALTASAVLYLIFPTNVGLGGTHPQSNIWTSFILEFLLTFLLLLVILILSRVNKRGMFYTALILGTVIFLEAHFGGPVSGASMNPARSLGPALISGQVHDLWIYLAAPITGATAAIPVWKWFFRSI